MISEVRERVERYYFLPKPYFRNSMIDHKDCELKIRSASGDSDYAEFILWCITCKRKILNEFALSTGEHTEMASVPESLVSHHPNETDEEKFKKEDARQNAWVFLQNFALVEEMQKRKLTPYKQDEDKFDLYGGYDILESYDECMPDELKDLLDQDLMEHDFVGNLNSALEEE